jgi:hypothetical protein
MTKTYLNASEMACAFPLAVRDDARIAFSEFPATRLLGESFSLQLGNDLVTLPGRIHNDPTLIHVDSLTDIQREMVDCLLTRHTSGFIRERHLTRVIRSGHVWVPPFVIKLVGEYVVEILRVILQNLNCLDASVYAAFLRANAAFLATTERRVTSYWDCYHRSQKPEEYVGFQLLNFFRSLMNNGGGIDR